MGTFRRLKRDLLPSRLVASHALRRLEIENAALRAELEELYASRTWALAARFRSLKQNFLRLLQGRPLIARKSESMKAHSSRGAVTDRPRIAYLIPGKGLSGGTAVICQHANRLRARGFEVMLIDVLEDSRPLDWFPGQQAPVIPFSSAPKHLDIAIATGWQTVPFLEQLTAARKMYFVQSDESRFTEDVRLKARILATYLRPYEYFTEALWIQRWLKNDFGHSSVYAPNGLDPEIIHPADPLVPRGGRLRVLLEGPISIPFKGMADAFAAVKDLDCEVWCVSSHGVPEPGWRCDRFFSAVPMSEMRRIYSSCDVLLKMSRVEGFFGPPLEMMACGGAVVVSKVTGYDEYIIDGVNALVVEPGDVSGARRAVHQLLEDAALRRELVAAGSKTADAWRWEPTIARLVALFSEPPTQSRPTGGEAVVSNPSHPVAQIWR